MTTAQKSAEALGYRLPSTDTERHAAMADHHAKMAALFARVGNTDMAKQASTAARKARAK